MDRVKKKLQQNAAEKERKQIQSFFNKDLQKIENPRANKGYKIVDFNVHSGDLVSKKDFRLAVKCAVSSDVTIGEIEFGGRYRVNLQKEKDSLIVMSDDLRNIGAGDPVHLSVYKPEDAPAFEPFKDGQRFEVEKNSVRLEDRRTGGDWNETAVKYVVPVFEYSEKVGITPVGVNQVSGLSHHAGGAGGFTEKENKFISWEDWKAEHPNETVSFELGKEFEPKPRHREKRSSLGEQLRRADEQWASLSSADQSKYSAMRSRGA